MGLPPHTHTYTPRIRRARAHPRSYTHARESPFTLPLKPRCDWDRGPIHSTRTGSKNSFIFSGANPHAVLGVGDGLSLTGYESFVNLNPRHAQVLIETNKAPHYGECHAEESDVEDIKDDVVDALKDAIDHDADPKTHQGLRYSQALKGCVSVFQEDEAVAKQLAGYEPFPVPKRLKVG